jgi:predicted DsbA family dithiol-disulfide isomerase
MNETERDDPLEEEEPDAPRERASIIIISDFVCPWCYIGLEEVERLKQEYDFDVAYAPFYLNPGTPPEGMPSRHITPLESPKTHLEERGEDLGIKFSRGRTWTSNSHLAFEAAEFASEYSEDQRRFRELLFKAYFEDVANIGDIDTLVRVGSEAGLPETALREALVDGRYRDRVDEGIAWSRAIGVTAVPTFVFNEQHGMVGAHELPAFRQMMEKIGQPPRAEQ